MKQFLLSCHRSLLTPPFVRKFYKKISVIR
nr:MAG TPA: hypothetical protein [Caudoviricetes sp.]